MRNKKYSKDGYTLLYYFVLIVLFYSFASLMLQQYKINIPLLTPRFNSIINAILLVIGIALVIMNHKVKLYEVWFLLLAVTSVLSTLNNVSIYANDTLFVVLMICNQLFWFSLFLVFSRCAWCMSNLCDMENSLVIFAYLLLVVNLLYFIGRYENSSATVYYSLCLIPIFLLRIKTVLSKIAIFLVFLLVFISNKRTGIIALIIALILYIIISGKINEKKNKIVNRFIYLLLILLVFYIVVSFVNHRYGVDVISNFIGLSSDGGSHRDIIYTSVFENIKQSDLMHFVFGHGYNSVFYNHIAIDLSSASFTSGHSDFLEVLYDYGLIGFISYIAIIIRFIYQAILMYKNRYKFTGAYVASIVIFLVLSTFSHLIIYQTYFAIIIMIWCYLIQDFRSTFTR